MGGPGLLQIYLDSFFTGSKKVIFFNRSPAFASINVEKTVDRTHAPIDPFALALSAQSLAHSPPRIADQKSLT